MISKVFRFIIALTIILLLALPATNTSAQDPAPWEITVDSTLDAPDVANNSICSSGTPTGGLCTLRAAIDEANKCTLDPITCEGGVIIHVPPGTYTLTIPPDSINDNDTGDLDIDILYAQPIYIIEGTDSAHPPVIDAKGLDRVFHIFNASTPVTLRYLVIKGGNLNIVNGNTVDKDGAGISNRGILELDSVVIENNLIHYVSGTYGICEGGVGGGIYSDNQLTMNVSSVRNNGAPCGGGLFLTNVQSKTILDSTISGNQAVYSGGGIFNYGPTIIQNSTVSNNEAGSYGGILNYGTINLYNVTIASNMSADGSAANVSNPGTFNIRNSIIAYPVSGHIVSNCQNTGVWSASGINLYSDSSCGTGAGILSNTDPKLTPLAWLGGPTMTRGLLAGSPAHDAVVGFCSDMNSYTLTIDQRGANRDSHCDLGAFEGVAYGVYLPMIRR